MTDCIPTSIIDRPCPKPAPLPEQLAAAWVAARFRRQPATARVIAEHALLGGLATRGR